MLARDDIPLELTSTVISQTDDGQYSFDLQGFLLPHEMMRREMRRGEKAARNLDCIKHPWKAKAFAEWFIDFFNPIMYAHHNIEENIIFPFYLQLNVIAPDRQSEDHMALISRLNRIERACKHLLLLVESSSSTTDFHEIKVEQDEITLQFLDLCEHMNEHFAEEELYWPKILRRCGKENWDKIEPLAIDHALKFGDTNAGEPYRLMLCAIARAQGIQIANDSFSPGETRWASKAFQEGYISTRPFYIRYIRMRAWNERYRNFRLLIEKVASADNQENLLLAPKVIDSGKYVRRTQKPLWPVYIFFYLSLFYVLCVGPYLAAISNPEENVKYLNIAVENMDDGFVGEYFVSYLNNYTAARTEFPTFRYRYGESVHDLHNAVRDGEVWAAVFLEPNISMSLEAAMDNGCAKGNEYNAKNAIKFIWDEGRNNAVANRYIFDTLTNLLNDFSLYFSQSYIRSLDSSTIMSCIASGQQSLIVKPIDHTGTNISPVDISPVVVNGGITIGNIYVAVFGATFIVNGALGATAAIAEDLSPMKRVALRSGTMLALGFGLSVCYATMIVAFSYQGSSHHLYSGDKWAQIFAVSWVHYTIWSFGHAWELETFGSALFPFFFGFLLLSSIIGGWNTDLADQGYKHFYQIFPFHWVIHLMRNIYYDSQEYRRGISAGILVAYALVMMGGYIYTSLRREMKSVGIKKCVHLEPLDDDDVEAIVSLQDAGQQRGEYAMVSSPQDVSFINKDRSRSRSRSRSRGDSNVDIMTTPRAVEINFERKVGNP